MENVYEDNIKEENINNIDGISLNVPENTENNNEEINNTCNNDNNSYDELHVLTETENKLDEKVGETVKKKEKKKNRPSSVSLADKSELFNRIVDIALECEKIVIENKTIKDKKDNLEKENVILKETIQNIEHTNTIQADEIVQLKDELSHRNEVIDIVKADKGKSFEEYKNTLTADLNIYYKDYMELKEMEMSIEVGMALQDTLEGVFKKLAKNGIFLE